jgi:hypothetical protein
MSRIETIVGIDPGVKGGICIWNKGAAEPCLLEKLPFDGNKLDPNRLVAMLEKANCHPSKMLVVSELVLTIPGMKAMNMGTVGSNSGATRAAVLMFGAEWETVNPRTWQKDLSFAQQKKLIGSKDPKEVALWVFKCLMPTILDNVKGPRGGVYDGLVDAALICWWAKSIKWSRLKK